MIRVRSLFALIQTPVKTTGVSWPYCIKVVDSTRVPYVETLYEKKRKSETGLLTKKEIESMGADPPCGPRVHIVPLRFVDQE